MTMKRKEINPQYSNRTKSNPYRLIAICILIFLALFAVVILTAPSESDDTIPEENESINQSEPVNISYEDYAYLSQKIDHYTNHSAEDITVSYSNYNSQDGVMIAEGTYIRQGYIIEYKALVYDNGNYEINEY